MLRNTLVFGLLVLTAACSIETNESAASCPDDLPKSCPASPPSYHATVAEIVQSHCTECHSKNGTQEPPLLESYEDLYQARREALSQIYHCLMPRPEATTPLSAADRKALLAWFSCGAPDN